MTDARIHAERAQAERDARQRNRARADGSAERWIVRRAPERGWEVVRISAPGLRFSGDDRTLTGGRGPARAVPEDPRPFIQRAIPPYGPN